MSTRQQGNRIENVVAKILEEEHGYYCYASRGSRGIDLIALHPGDSLPHLGVEVGTESKSVRSAFRKLNEGAKRYPGMYFLVVRRCKRGARNIFRWHATAGKWGHDTFEDALAEARAL